MGGGDRKLPGEEAAGVQGRLGVNKSGGLLLSLGWCGEKSMGWGGQQSRRASLGLLPLW